MKIIKVLPNDRLIVQFQDEFKYEKEIHWNNFQRGTVKNPYDKTLYDIGYLGVGKYKAFIDNKAHKTIEYSFWINIMERCYSEKRRHRYKTYEDCYMVKEWCNFQNFAQWVEGNYYKVEGERMQIDKDILFSGNNEYAPDKCLIVPQRINMMFMKKAKTKDIDLPNAIYRCKNGYKASYGGKALGVFKTVNDAVNAHDGAMRVHIKQVVEEYGNKLPPKVREALLNW